MGALASPKIDLSTGCYPIRINQPTANRECGVGPTHTASSDFGQRLDDV